MLSELFPSGTDVIDFSLAFSIPATIAFKIGNIVSDLNETFEEIDEKISEIALEIGELDLEE